jgi:hypothetical protein
VGKSKGEQDNNNVFEELSAAEVFRDDSDSSAINSEFDWDTPLPRAWDPDVHPPYMDYTTSLCTLMDAIVDVGMEVRKREDQVADGKLRKMVRAIAEVIARDPKPDERSVATKEMLEYCTSIRDKLPRAILKQSGYYKTPSLLRMSEMLIQAQKYCSVNNKIPTEFQWSVYDSMAQMDSQEIMVARAPSVNSTVVHSLLCTRVNETYKLEA